MTRVTILAGAAAAIILLGLAALNASPYRETHAAESPHVLAGTHAQANAGMIPR